MITLITTGILESTKEETTNKGTKLKKATISVGKLGQATYETKYEVEVWSEWLMKQLDEIPNGSIIQVVGTPNISPFMNKNNEPSYKLRIRANTLNVLNKDNNNNTQANTYNPADFE